MRRNGLLMTSVLLLLAGVNGRDFRARPRQKVNKYWLNKDFTKIPYQDKLNYAHAGFKVKEYDMQDYTIDEWKEVEDKFTGEDYYHILIAANETTVKIFALSRFFQLKIDFFNFESSCLLNTCTISAGLQRCT